MFTTAELEKYSLIKMKGSFLGENYRVQNQLGMCHRPERESSFLVADDGDEVREVEVRPDENLGPIEVKMDD